MKVKTISYQRVFPLASYVNEKIGVEVELDERDLPEEVFATAKWMVDSWGTKIENDYAMPEMQAMKSNVDDLLNGRPLTSAYLKAPLLGVQDLKKETTEIAIDNATTIEQLDLLMGDAAKYGLAKELNEKKRKLNETR